MKHIQYTVLIVEDDESMRDTLNATLKKEYRLIMAKNGTEALKAVKQNEIQIALIDIRLPDIRGTEILKAIKNERPDTECIMMSVIKDADTIIECMKYGAYDYITKEFDSDILIHRMKNAETLYHKKRQIRDLHRKIQTLESEISLLRKGAASPSPPHSRFKGRSDWGDCILTERESEIIRLKAAGLSNEEAADKLFISLLTVKNHIKSILHKLNANSIIHAVSIAYKRGILKI